MNKASKLLGMLEDGEVGAPNAEPKGEREAMAAALKQLASTYHFEKGQNQGNAKETMVGTYEDAKIQLINYGSFISIKMAFGEVRHSDTPARNPQGEHGLVSATSSYGQGAGGQALKGYDLQGLKWRIGAAFPMSNTGVPEVGDGYVKSDDIIKYMYGLKDKVSQGKKADGDATGAWSEMEQGW